MLKINLSTMLILMNKYDKKERERERDGEGRKQKGRGGGGGGGERVTDKRRREGKFRGRERWTYEGGRGKEGGEHGRKIEAD